jgi:hypothetical protein
MPLRPWDQSGVGRVSQVDTSPTSGSIAISNFLVVDFEVTETFPVAKSVDLANGNGIDQVLEFNPGMVDRVPSIPATAPFL